MNITDPIGYYSLKDISLKNKIINVLLLLIMEIVMLYRIIINYERCFPLIL